MQTYRAKGQDLQSGHRAHVRGGRFSLRRLWRDEAGTTAIEFAFIALGLVYLMIGIIEFSLAMTVGNSLEAATNLSSRLGKTGYVDEVAETQEQTIMDEIERRVGPMIDMTKLVITHQEYNDFDSLTSPDLINDINGDGDTSDPGESWTDVDGDGFHDGGNGVGASGNIVVYKIMYPWKVFTPLIGDIIGNEGVINLVAYSVVKNEPY
jgi:Flp pilus assembly pilin Flp